MSRFASKFMMYCVAAGVLAGTLALLVACSPGSRKAATAVEQASLRRAQMAGEVNEMRLQEATKLAYAEDAMAASGGQQGIPGAASLAALMSSQPDRYLIKHCTLRLEVADARSATDQLLAVVRALEGYVSNLKENSGPVGQRSVTIELRIPSDQFDQALPQLESVGTILDKVVSTEDVTEQYVDTDAKARNLKKLEERLLDHLGRSAELNEVLRLETELTRVREQIESLEGRLRYLGNRVSFSTINIALIEAAKAEPIVPVETFSTASVFSAATRSLVGKLQEVWAMAIWAIVWSPVWLLPVIAFILIWRRLSRLVRARAVTT